MASDINVNLFCENNLNNFNEYNSAKGLKLIHLNTRSLVKKISEIKIKLNEFKPEIFAITESWLTQQHFDCEYNVNNYTMYRKDRDSSSRGGGIVVYLKNDSNFSHEEVIINNEIGFELLVIKIKQNISKPYFVLITYIKPKLINQKIIDEMNDILRQFKDNECLVVGDINMDQIENGSNIWFENMRDNGFKQLISSPTRMSSILDHIYTNRPNNINSSGVLMLDISDHFGVYFVRKLRSGQRLRTGTNKFYTETGNQLIMK